MADPPALQEERPTATVDGLPVSRLALNETVLLIERWLLRPGCRRVATANLDFLALAHHDPDLRRALATADLVTADGVPVLWLARAGGSRVPQRVSGADLLPRLLDSCARLGVPVFLLGGAPGSAARAANLALATYRGLKIVGVEAPVVDLKDEATCQAIASRVRASGAGLLLVGLGCPKQELFLESFQAQTGCRVGIGIGGAFSFLAGDLQRAPRFMQRAGLEWLFRLALEPRRLAGRYWRDARYLLGALWRETNARRGRTCVAAPRAGARVVDRRKGDAGTIEP